MQQGRNISSIDELIMKFILEDVPKSNADREGITSPLYATIIPAYTKD